MTQQQRFQSQTWRPFTGPYSIFDQDFISDKLIFKFNNKNPLYNIAYKNTFDIGKVIQGHDELKLELPYNTHSRLYLRLKSSDQYKIQTGTKINDHQSYKLGFSYNSFLQAGNTSEQSYQKVICGLQATHYSWKAKFNAIYNSMQNRYNNLIFTNQTNYSTNRWSFSLINAARLFNIQWQHSIQWLHSALQIGWQDKYGSDYYIRFNTGKSFTSRKEFSFLNIFKQINNFTADFIYNHSPNNRIGLQVQGNFLRNQYFVAAALWDHTCTDMANTGVKFKADFNRNIAIAIKNNIEGYGKYLLGVNIADLGGDNKFTYGIQLELDL